MTVEKDDQIQGKIGKELNKTRMIYFEVDIQT